MSERLISAHNRLRTEVKWPLTVNVHIGVVRLHGRRQHKQEERRKYAEKGAANGAAPGALLLSTIVRPTL